MQLIAPAVAVRRAAVVAAALLPALLGGGPAFGLEWRKASQKCEPPWVFHNADCSTTGGKEKPNCHRSGRPPCCPMVACPAGTQCLCDSPTADNPTPLQGTCIRTNPPEQGRPEQYKTRDVRCPCDGSGSASMSPDMTSDTRKSVVMFVTDDQASCAYRRAGTCYSNQTGQPIPAPFTPALDELAARGTTFPIVHNTASWCIPSLASIITGRYQANMGKVSNRSETFATVPAVLRSATIQAGNTEDTYETQTWLGAPGGRATPVGRVGGYCTYFGGKFLPQFANASAKGRQQGRFEDCVSRGTLPPECAVLSEDVNGTAVRPPRFTTQGMTDLFDFIDSMIITFEQTGSGPSPRAATWQRFFAWHFPYIPHRPLVASDHPSVTFLFGPDGSSGWFARELLMQPPGERAAWRFPGSTLAEGEQQRTTDQYYGSVFMADENLRVIREYLRRRGLDEHTVIIHLSDNPWFMLRSKKNSTENGYRTRLIVYDPAHAPGGETMPPGRQNFEAVHSNDVLPTLLNYASRAAPPATGGGPTTTTLPARVDCPVSPNHPAGTSGRCDGLDLSAQLLDAAGNPLAVQGVRPHLCGHLTKKASSPERKRFLITGQWKTGRCVPRAGTPLPAGFTTDANALYGMPPHAMFPANREERTLSPAEAEEGSKEGRPCCPDPTIACDNPRDMAGIWIGKVCRAAPACVFDDSGTWNSCQDLFGEGTMLECAPPATATKGWCVAKPNRQCASADDCQCEGDDPCDRTCTARLFKLYVGAPGSGDTPDLPELAMTDLLLDPNERQARPADNLGDGTPDGILERRDVGTVAGFMSGARSGSDPYAGTRKRLSCCVEEWWSVLDPFGSQQPTGRGYCARGFACPSTPGCS